MTDGDATIWRPCAEDIAEAQVTALARRLGQPDYESLRRFSTEQPAAYWAGATEFLGLVWSRAPEGFADLSGGREFPRWFPGGELNWVDTILAWGEDPAFAARPAVIAERENGAVARVSFAELAGQVRAFAAGLAELGVVRGERIGLFTENGLEATVSLLAIAYLGAIVVPLFSGFGVEAVVSRLEACGARGLIATAGFERRGRRVDIGAVVREALQRLPSIDLVIWNASREAAPQGATLWSDIAKAAAPPVPSARMAPDDPFMVIYTSGTTGKPKGAVHTHAGFPLKVAHDSAVNFDVGAGDVFCWPADMGWIAGSLVMTAALTRGATLVCYDGAPDFPDWSRMSRLVERYRVTHLGSTPTLIRALAANMPAATAGDLSSIELLITSGEVIDPEHFAWFQRHFGRGVRPLINYTGGTEVSGGLLSSVVVRPIRPAAFNTTALAIEVGVVDVDGRPVVDAVGELAILAPFVGQTRSFWQDDERYLESYWRAIPGLWIHGDLALQTPNGDYFVLGRSDDTIKLAGKRLGPAEVEETLVDLPGVAEAAAIGVDDAAKGQKLVVFVIPASGWDGEEAALARAVTDRVDQRLGRPFRPAAVHVVAQLPRTRSGKVMRRVIRGLYGGRSPGDLTALDNPASLDEIRRSAPA